MPKEYTVTLIISISDDEIKGRNEQELLKEARELLLEEPQLMPMSILDLHETTPEEAFTLQQLFYSEQE